MVKRAPLFANWNVFFFFLFPIFEILVQIFHFFSRIILDFRNFEFESRFFFRIRKIVRRFHLFLDFNSNFLEILWKWNFSIFHFTRFFGILKVEYFILSEARDFPNFRDCKPNLDICPNFEIFKRLQFFSKFLILLANFRKSCHFFLIHIHSISFKGFMEHTKRYKTVSRPKLYKISLEASCKVSRSIVKIVSSPIKCSILLFPVQLYLSLASTL